MHWEIPSSPLLLAQSLRLRNNREKYFLFYMVLETQNTQGLQSFTLLQQRQQRTTQLLSSEKKPYWWLIHMTGIKNIGRDGANCVFLNFCDSYSWVLLAFLSIFSVFFIPWNKDLILGSLMLKLEFLVMTICSVNLKDQEEWPRKNIDGNN